MKITNCKLCDTYDNQKLSSDDKGNSINAQPQFCRHTSPAAAFISPTFRDLLAFHLLRGYYQPAGPLISPHLLPPPPQSIPQPLESDQQSSQSSASTTDNVDPDVMITGGDLAPRPPYRYNPHPPPPDYSRPMHQMHYQTYSPSPYGYYSQPPHPPPHPEVCYSPYYPPKFYPQNAPYGRRYMTPNYYQPQPLDYRPPPQAVPQNAPSQIMPATPTPQHLDHYPNPPYYAGYSPNGGGPCYSQTQPRNMQPPYLDAPQYHSSSCPCPMQSCPKNAHTGTGPTKAKGPVSANNSIAIEENIPKTPAIVPTSSVSCKIENILAPNVVIKPENKDKPSSSSDVYTSKVLELPESTPSPARGSIGLQIPPTVQHEAVQPTESNSDNLNLSQRKQPRVGKSMERERQQQQHITMIGYQTTLDNAEVMPQFKQEFSVKREGDVKKEKDCEEIDMGYRNMKPIENVKLERPEPLSTTSTISANTQAAPKQIDQQNKAVVETVTVNLINESGDDECVDYTMKRKLNDSHSSGSSSSDDVIELSDNSTVDPPSMTLKRRKLLEKPAVCTPKKSPPNSYKSLIKQTSPSSTYPAPSSKAKLITSTMSRLGSKPCIKRRSILKTKSALEKMRLAVKAKKRAQKKKKSEVENDKSVSLNNDEAPKADEEVSTEKSVEETSTEHNEDKSMDGSSEYSGKSNIDLTIDRVAKGYFSESDIFSCLSKHRKKTKSQKKFDAKLLKAGISDKKKDKKSKADASVVSEKPKKKSVKVNKEADIKQTAEADGDKNEVTKTNKTKKSKTDEGEKKKKSKKKVKEVEIIVEKDPLALDDAPASHSTPKRKQKPPKNVEKKTKKAKVSDVVVVEKVIETTPVVESDEDDKTTVETVETRDEETSTTVLSSNQTNKSLLDETDVANNNNECFEDNNSRQKQQQQESLTLYKTPGYGWMAINKTGKRGKKAKFGNRKKQKFTLLNDIVIPKSTSIPRWSNGWVWEGEPFQALVFLNSDDPPVPRTCYDAMRHEECGDVIRPRDCVLLRAGGKRNELPYVAKVAQLWENPEDGEMMMSLFWYYRPEHTEQGRLENDASDEVFASRHKDHNSVACIEDKCYVLTYNEYCRYRRSLKSLEENLDEQPSLVPRLNFPDRRVVPPQTSPELVMFCRRVYDFRGKRLVEDKKKK